MPTFQSLYEDNRETLRLSWIAGQSSAGKALDTPSTAGLASADLVGHLNLIHPNRLHVLGEAEVRYYAQMEPSRRLHYASELIAGKPIGIVIGEGLTPPPNWSTPPNAPACPPLPRLNRPPRSSKCCASTSRRCSLPIARCMAC